MLVVFILYSSTQYSAGIEYKNHCIILADDLGYGEF